MRSLLKMFIVYVEFDLRSEPPGVVPFCILVLLIAGASSFATKGFAAAFKVPFYADGAVVALLKPLSSSLFSCGLFLLLNRGLCPEN
jgi:hypothetical protein